MNKLPKLTLYKQKECPTCKAKPGENCSSIGEHGSTAGNVMSTSVHAARRKAAGEGKPPAKKFDHTLAGRKAWRTRRANEQARLQALTEHIPIPAPSRLKLIETILEMLDIGGVNHVTLSQEGGVTVSGRVGNYDQEGKYILEVSKG